MTDFASSNPVFGIRQQPFAVDASGRLDQDVTCRKCGYNLRSLSPQGVCTECGTPVGRSLMGDLLRFSDPKWVRLLASGMDWILVGFIIIILSSCLIGAAVGAMGVPQFVLIAFQTVMGFIPLVGYWKVTTPDPGGLEDSELDRVRRTLRGAYLLNFGLTPVQLVLMEKQPIAGIGVALASAVVGVVVTVSTFRFGRMMARRIPDDQLARSCRSLMWLTIAVWIVGVVAGAALILVSIRGMTAVRTAPPITTSAASFTVTGGSNSGFTATRVGRGVVAPVPAATNWVPVAAGGCVFGVLALIAAIWSIVLFFRFRSAFHNAALLALQSWAAPASEGLR